MADTRTLKLALLADVNKFLGGMNEAEMGTKGLNDKIGKYSKAMAKSFAIAGAAAGAYAIKLGIDGVKAAVEDEASQKQLAIALKNTTNATDAQIKSTEDYISKQQLAFGVADTKLRPALANLARATGDVGKAQQLTNLSMDIAAATGKDLETVSLTLAKAYNGNIGALTKLGIPLDDAIKKSGDFNLVQAELVKLFGGAAQANTQTYAGQLAIVTERVGELKEGIGIALLPTLSLFLENLNMMAKAIGGDDPQGLTERARELAGTYDGQGGGAYNLGLALKNVADAFTAMFTAINDGEPGSTSALQTFADALNAVARGINAIKDAYNTAKSFMGTLVDTLVIGEGRAGFASFVPGIPGGAARAAGGSVMGGQAYRVGEFGPEMFVPSGSGSIRPAGGSGQTIINLNGIIDAESARRSIEKLLQDSARRTGPINLVGANL
jgi:hypothetical protein